MADENILQVNNLTIGYGKNLVQEGISFSLKEGEALGIVGANGIGKTTLFKTILGVIPPLGGEIVFKGKTIKTAGERGWLRSAIGYVPQGRGRGKLPLPVEEMVLLGRWGIQFSYCKRPSVLDRNKAEEAIEIMALTELKKRDCRELSGGEYQRAVIARALAREAVLLLLDEPTTYLDYQSRREFLALLSRLRRDLGLSLLIVSHHHEELESLTDRFLFLQGKRGVSA